MYFVKYHKWINWKYGFSAIILVGSVWWRSGVWGSLLSQTCRRVRAHLLSPYRHTPGRNPLNALCCASSKLLVKFVIVAGCSKLFSVWCFHSSNGAVVICVVRGASELRFRATTVSVCASAYTSVVTGVFSLKPHFHLPLLAHFNRSGLRCVKNVEHKV